MFFIFSWHSQRCRVCTLPCLKAPQALQDATVCRTASAGTLAYKAHSRNSRTKQVIKSRAVRIQTQELASSPQTPVPINLHQLREGLRKTHTAQSYVLNRTVCWNSNPVSLWRTLFLRLGLTSQASFKIATSVPQPCCHAATIPM